MAKRYRRGTGAASYSSYIASLKAAPSPPTGPRSVAHVFAATCSGLTRLSRDFGVPLAFIGVAKEVREEVRRLGARLHGSCLPWTHDGSSFAAEDGWDDWRPARFGPAMAASGELAPGVRLDNGVLRVALPSPIPLASLRLGVASSLRHMRFEDMCNRGDAVGHRITSNRPSVATSRYTPVSPSDRGTCTRADDLYVVHPWLGAQLVACHVAAALSAKAEEHGPARVRSTFD